MRFPKEWLFCSVLVISAFSLRAQAPEPAPLAHGSVPGEPHHHLKIENEYVRAHYVEVPPHEATQLHQHDHDYIYISLGPADVINAVLDKPEVHLVLKDGETHFIRGGFAHVARNLSDAPFRNVTIELLKPQRELKNLCGQIAPAAGSAGCDQTVAYGPGGRGSFVVEPQMETLEASLDLVRLGPEAISPGVAVPSETLVVTLNDSEVQINLPGSATKTKMLQAGEMTWIGTGLRAVASNPGKKPSSYLQLTCVAAKAH